MHFDKQVGQISKLAKNPSPYINTIRSVKSQPPQMSQPSKEARINLALQALKNEPKLSIRRAAEIYEVNRNTLCNRKNGKQPRREIMSNLRKLSKLEEETVLQYTLDLNSRGFPCRISVVEEMANRLLAARDAPPVGKRWAINFIKRQPELKSHRLYDGYDFNRQSSYKCREAWKAKISPAWKSRMGYCGRGDQRRRSIDPAVHHIITRPTSKHITRRRTSSRFICLLIHLIYFSLLILHVLDR
ncbi:Uncharacterized protein HZ326_24400 [Fusarium oxysporum f. sp. albedinis]|nr:Uncharacterized protein HZ326_24400 [Fusarium oxysporum f. sp. albedinis]